MDHADSTGLIGVATRLVDGHWDQHDDPGMGVFRGLSNGGSLDLTHHWHDCVRLHVRPVPSAAPQAERDLLEGEQLSRTKSEDEHAVSTAPFQAVDALPQGRGDDLRGIRATS